MARLGCEVSLRSRQLDLPCCAGTFSRQEVQPSGSLAAGVAVAVPAPAVRAGPLAERCEGSCHAHRFWCLAGRCSRSCRWGSWGTQRLRQPSRDWAVVWAWACLTPASLALKPFRMPPAWGPCLRPGAQGCQTGWHCGFGGLGSRLLFFSSSVSSLECTEFWVFFFLSPKEGWNPNSLGHTTGAVIKSCFLCFHWVWVLVILSMNECGGLFKRRYWVSQDHSVGSGRGCRQETSNQKCSIF